MTFSLPLEVEFDWRGRYVLRCTCLPRDGHSDCELRPSRIPSHRPNPPAAPASRGPAGAAVNLPDYKLNEIKQFHCSLGEKLKPSPSSPGPDLHPLPTRRSPTLNQLNFPVSNCDPLLLPKEVVYSPLPLVPRVQFAGLSFIKNLFSSHHQPELHLIHVYVFLLL